MWRLQKPCWSSETAIQMPSTAMGEHHFAWHCLPPRTTRTNSFALPCVEMPGATSSVLAPTALVVVRPGAPSFYAPSSTASPVRSTFLPFTNVRGTANDRLRTTPKRAELKLLSSCENSEPQMRQSTPSYAQQVLFATCSIFDQKTLYGTTLSTVLPAQRAHCFF